MFSNSLKNKTKSLLLSFVLIASLTPMTTHANALTNDKTFLEKYLKSKEVASSNQAITLQRVIIQADEQGITTLKESLQKLLGDFEIKQQFDLVFNGLSLDVPQNLIPVISSLPGVKKVQIARSFYPTMADAKALTQIQNVWNNKQYQGEGMVVSIIDTGIDVNHKDMRLDKPELAKIKNIKQSSQTSFTTKVPYGYNYADGNDIVKDSDEHNKSMHGMHVAGIVGANATDEDIANNLGIDGVAPEAQLLAMKVFTNNADRSSAYEDSIVKAIEDSVKLGADVINMSLGTDNGFANEEAPEAIAIRKAQEAGVVVVVSAGNAAMSTTADEHTRIPTNTLELNDNAAVGEPSTSKYALSVASSNNATETGYYGLIGETNFLFKIASHKELWNVNQSYDIVDVNLGREEDYVDNNGNQLDLTGKIAFVSRGEIYFSDKYQQAINHNAAGIIVANNSEGDFNMANIDNFILPGITVDQSTGEFLKTKIRNNEKIKINFENKSFIGSNEVSSFTSWGPATDLSFKPEIMAPGGNIYSTLNNNQYGLQSGTSMAAPHISGAIALMKGALLNTNLPKDFTTFAKISLMNTAKPLLDIAQATNLEVSPRRQGAGLAQIEDAINNRVLITDENGHAAKALKEVQDETQFTLTLENLSDEEKTYTIRFGNVLTEELDESTKQVKNVVMENATISANRNTITIAPHSKTNVTVTLNLAQAPLQKFVEGYIYFESLNHTTLTYPYMGFHGDWGLESPFDVPKDVDTNNDFQYDGVYNTLGLVSGSSYLGSTFNMFTFSETVDQDKVAFSPNGDDNFDSFTTVLALLRNVMTLDVDVVDEISDSKEAIVHLTTTHNVRKSLFKSKDMVNFFNGNWDGKIFNAQTGKYEIASDGQYYVRLRATMPSNITKYHYVYLPIKIDTTKPEVTLISQEDDGTDLIFKFKAVDYGIGLADEGVGVILDDGDKETIEDDGAGNYEYRLSKASLNDGKSHMITIGALDSVYNVKTLVITLDSQAVMFHNFNELVGSKNKYFNAEGYNLLGKVGENVASLTINDQDVILDDHSFEYRIPLVEGENTVHFVAKDLNGNIINDYNKKIILDTTPPNITINNFNPNEVQYLTDNKLKVTGKVDLNENEKINVQLGYTRANLDSDGNFDATMNIDWTRVGVIRATDQAGNETVIRVRTVFEEQGALKIYFGDSLSTINYYNADSSKYVHDDAITITGHTNKKVYTLYIGNKQVTLDNENRFSVEYPLVEVDNHISIRAYDENNNLIYEEGRVVYYDKTLPELTLNLGNLNENQEIYTNQTAFKLSGSISDNGQGYRVYVNGNELIVLEETASLGNEHSLRNFEKVINIQNNDKLLFEVSDSLGNKFDRTYTFILDQIAPKITVEGIEKGKLTLPNTIKTNSDETATIRMSIDGVEYTGNESIPSGNHTLIVEAIDLAGNKTVESVDFEAVHTYTVNQTKTLTAQINSLPNFSNAYVVKNEVNEVVEIKSLNVLSSIPTTTGTLELTVALLLHDGTVITTNMTVNYTPQPVTISNGEVSVENVYTERKVNLVTEKLSLDTNSKVDVYDMYAVDETNQKQNLANGKYIINIRVSKPVKNVYLIDQNGEYQNITFTQINGLVTFETINLTKYAIEYVDEAVIAVNTKNDVKTGNLPYEYYLLLCLGSSLLYLINRKKA